MEAESPAEMPADAEPTLRPEIPTFFRSMSWVTPSCPINQQVQLLKQLDQAARDALQACGRLPTEMSDRYNHRG